MGLLAQENAGERHLDRLASMGLLAQENAGERHLDRLASTGGTNGRCQATAGTGAEPG